MIDCGCIFVRLLFHVLVDVLIRHRPKKTAACSADATPLRACRIRCAESDADAQSKPDLLAQRLSRGVPREPVGNFVRGSLEIAQPRRDADHFLVAVRRKIGLIFSGTGGF